MFKWLKKLLHIHMWRGMEYDEWMEAGGFGTPDYICDKCGDRRYWSQT